ncbi:MAG: chromate transporter, partial [Candidatus Limnocylindrales bacterium]
PAWDRIRGRFAPALRGINAVVVGLLAAALVNPLWTSTVRSVGDVAIVVAGLGLLVFGRAPPILVVAFSAAGAIALSALGG